MNKIELRHLSEEETFGNIQKNITETTKVIQLSHCIISDSCINRILIDEHIKSLTLYHCTIESSIFENLLKKLIINNKSLKNLNYEFCGYPYLSTIKPQLNIFKNAFLANQYDLNELIFKFKSNEFLFKFKFTKNGVDKKLFTEIYIEYDPDYGYYKRDEESKNIIINNPYHKLIETIRMINNNFDPHSIQNFYLNTRNDYLFLNSFTRKELVKLYSLHKDSLETFRCEHSTRKDDQSFIDFFITRPDINISNTLKTFGSSCEREDQILALEALITSNSNSIQEVILNFSVIRSDYLNRLAAAQTTAINQGKLVIISDYSRYNQKPTLEIDENNEFIKESLNNKNSEIAAETPSSQTKLTLQV